MIVGEVEGVELVELEVFGVEIVVLEGVVSKLNCWKYLCLKCEINVWGKLGLSLICGEC